MFPLSVPARAVAKAWDEFEVVYFPETLAELALVLQRRKFRNLISPEIVTRLLRYIERDAKMFKGSIPVVACRDPKDDKFLSLAVEAEAAYLLSSDKDLLELDAFLRTKIINPADFLLLESPAWPPGKQEGLP